MRPSAIASRGGSDRWLVSYADLMTLLLAFFATMYALSEVEGKRAKAARTPPTPVAAASSPAARSATAAPAGIGGPQAEVREAVRARLLAALQPDISAGRVEMYEDARGVVMSLPEGATFPRASADVVSEAAALLDTIARTLTPLEADVRVEGHTDDLPIRTARYASNWELSTARASAVVVRFIALGMEPRRLSAAGYGEFHPRVPNLDEAGRVRNRRVDLVVVGSAP
jgi:chemotaxis protein MotB